MRVGSPRALAGGGGHNKGNDDGEHHNLPEPGIAVAIVLGGAVAFRYSLNRTANEIQERVINALKSEIQTLQDRIVALEKDNTRLSQTIAIIRTALKQRGMSVTIDGDLISISDAQGNSTHASRIQGINPIAATNTEGK